MTARLLLLPAIAVLVAWLVTPLAAQAPPTAEQIEEQLLKKKVRGLSAPPGAAGRAPGLPHAPAAAGAPAAAPASDLTTPGAAGPPIVPPAADKATIDRIFDAPAAGSLSVRERQQISTLAEERPAIDLTIYFDFNSAEISPKAVPALVELGRALSRKSLAETRFLLAGHTDGKGGDAYNLKLSQRRAEAIRQFLIQQFKVDERRLLAIGYGKEQLKNKAAPFADENRRVQVVNFGG